MISLAGTVQNGLIYLYELNSTGGLNNRALDGILRSSHKSNQYEGVFFNLAFLPPLLGYTIL